MIIAFMIVATVFAIAALAYVTFDIIHEMKKKKGNEQAKVELEQARERLAQAKEKVHQYQFF